VLWLDFSHLTLADYIIGSKVSHQYILATLFTDHSQSKCILYSLLLHHFKNPCMSHNFKTSVSLT